MPTQNDSTMTVIPESMSPVSVVSQAKAKEASDRNGGRFRAGIVGLGRVGARRADCVLAIPRWSSAPSATSTLARPRSGPVLVHDRFQRPGP